MLKTALKPRWIAGLVFAIVVSGVFVLLSQWQFGRSTQPEVTVSATTEEPKPLTTALQPGDFFPGSVADQVVTATGSYDPQKQVLVPGRLNGGATGYWVVSALAVNGRPRPDRSRRFAADLDPGGPRLGCRPRGRRRAAVGHH